MDDLHIRQASKHLVAFMTQSNVKSSYGIDAFVGTMQEGLCRGLAHLGFTQESLCRGLARLGFTQESLCRGLARLGSTQESQCRDLARLEFMQERFGITCGFPSGRSSLIEAPT